jgi:hypothetical protein
MPKWEVCVIRMANETTKSTGFFSSDRTMYTWQAMLGEPSGALTVIAESQPFDNPNFRTVSIDQPSGHELRRLFAQLGFDAWEPMPLVSVHGGPSVSSHVEWYFKRQLPKAGWPSGLIQSGRYRPSSCHRISSIRSEMSC